MNELVNKKKLKEKLDELVYPLLLGKQESDLLDEALEACTLSPAELIKEDLENERKAEAWDKLYKSITMRDLVHFDIDLADLEERMDKLLAQSRVPPKAEEGK